MHTSLPKGSIFLAFLVALVWGFNFIMVKVGLDHLQPLTLCALRFLLASIPALFFVPKPKVCWSLIIAYGLLTFALQFSLIFGGMAAGVTPGVAALILQSQVFFAIFFVCFFAKQRLTAWQMIGGIISFGGIAVIAFHRNLDCTLAGFLLLLCSACVWGFSSLISIKLKNVNMLSVVVWGSFIAFFPLACAALIIEQPLIFLTHLNLLTWDAVLALLYISYLSTHFGYGVWSWLLSKYPTASITPFALLCPIVAMIASAYFFHETFEPWKLLSAVLVIFGLVLNLFGQVIYSRLMALRMQFLSES